MLSTNEQEQTDSRPSVVGHAPRAIHGHQWSLFAADPHSDRANVTWIFNPAKHADCPSYCHVKLALIIHHLHEPLNVDILRMGLLTNTKNRLKAFRNREERLIYFGMDRDERITLPLVPEENESILDDIDLEAWTAVQESDL